MLYIKYSRILYGEVITIRRLIKKIVVWSDSQILQIFIITLLFLFIFLLFIYTQNDVLTLVDATIISTFLITFFVSVLFNKSIDKLRVHVEDEIKVNYNADKLMKRYPAEIEEGSFFKNRGELCPIIVLYTHEPNKEIHISDSDKQYVLPNIITNYVDKILNAHKASKINHKKMVRLDDVRKTDKGVELFTSRTTYLDTLLTNRAIDYTLADRLTIRDVLEPGPYINDLKTSTLSNHLGFNIMVFDNEDNVILTKRAKSVTTAKGKWSFGGSGSLKLDNALNDNRELQIAGIEKSVKVNLENTLGINSKYIDFNLERDLICVYREMFEGGKPHFLLKCSINLSSDKIYSTFDTYKQKLTKKRKNKKELHITEIKLMNFSSLKNLNSHNNLRIGNENLELAHTVSSALKVAIYLLDRWSHNKN